MRFVSTRGGTVPVGFRQAVFQGLAPDGGLFHPVSEPDLSEVIAGFTQDTSFTDISFAITRSLFADEIQDEQARALCDKAFPFAPKLTNLAPGHDLLELYHGPSCAFKDFGASYLANVMQSFLAGESERAIILTATSGDTGSAVAQAFHGKDAIDVVILYPSGRVSPSQEMQLTTLGGNVHALEVQGSFDDCQRMVKQAFLDPGLSGELPLTSANSINLGRLIPQSFYYLWANSRGFEAEIGKPGGRRVFCVPSGNFGNLTAGIFAWRWGMPVDGFIAATNANDVVPRYLESGNYDPQASIHTHANAMDVGSPSNFERLQAIFDGDVKKMSGMIQGQRSSNQEILDTMKAYHENKGIFLCPHTAAGVRAGDLALKQGAADHVITLATAHPGKFSEIVELATGEKPEIPQRLAQFMSRQKQATVIEPSLEALAGFLRGKF